MAPRVLQSRWTGCLSRCCLSKLAGDEDLSVDNQRVPWLAQAIRRNLNDVSYRNTKSAIEDGKAPIAALVYALALIDSMAGSYYGLEAQRPARPNRPRGEVRVRYEAFVRDYLDAVAPECRCPELDLYRSLRCAMLHGLVAGRPNKTDCVFRLIWSGNANLHGTTAEDGRVSFDVDLFSAHVLQAGRKFLDDVEQAISQSPEPRLLKDFEAGASQGNAIMVKGWPVWHRHVLRRWPRSRP